MLYYHVAAFTVLRCSTSARIKSMKRYPTRHPYIVTLIATNVNRYPRLYASHTQHTANCSVKDLGHPGGEVKDLGHPGGEVWRGQRVTERKERRDGTEIGDGKRGEQMVKEKMNKRESK